MWLISDAQHSPMASLLPRCDKSVFSHLSKPATMIRQNGTSTLIVQIWVCLQTCVQSTAQPQASPLEILRALDISCRVPCFFSCATPPFLLLSLSAPQEILMHQQ